MDRSLTVEARTGPGVGGTVAVVTGDDDDGMMQRMTIESNL